MRHFKQEVSATLDTVSKGRPYSGDGLDALGKQVLRRVLNHYYEYRSAINELLNKPLPKKHEDLYCLLLVGMAAIDHLHQPAHASVNAAVETAKVLKKGWATGLVNATLRGFIRKRDTFHSGDAHSEESLWNHPEWLIQAIKRDWPHQCDSILAANLSQAPMTLRVNLQRTTRDAYTALLASEELEFSLSDQCDSAIRLDRPLPVKELPNFESGWVSVQDEAAQLASILLAPSEHERILDACAAPGGKACHLLELMPSIDLVALDIDPARCERIEDNFKRLSLKATLRCDDLITFAKSSQTFDAILLDAPCSGTGVIRRHPDIKLLRQPSDIVKLAATQSRLLEACWTLLKPGGRLLYATCSILRTENDVVIDQFLQKTPNATLTPIALPGAYLSSRGLQYFPEIDRQDGFFYSLLVKKV